MDRLEQMLRLQRNLQHRINGYDVDEQELPSVIANLSLNVLALTDELHELLNETSWKPWTTGEPYVRIHAARKEAIDAWHFLMNIFLHLGMTSDDVYRMYTEKNTVNIKRQDSAYDGQTGKCPACKRDLADVDLREVHAVMGALPRVDLHCVCGHYLGSRAV